MWDFLSFVLSDLWRFCGFVIIFALAISPLLAFIRALEASWSQCECGDDNEETV